MGRHMKIAGKKSKEDQRRGKIFGKLSKKISVAARNGSDMQFNAELATIVDEAKAMNMPKDNIERAIKKGAGELEGVEYLDLMYEGYGPSGVAVLVEVLTDNKNRAVAEMRHAFDKYGGNLGETGCVSFMFDHKGILVIANSDSIDDDEIMMEAIEAGAEDIDIDEEFIEIYTTVNDFGTVKNKFKADGYKFEMAELRYVPQNMIELTKPEDLENMEKMIDILEDNDDVQKVYHNWEIE
ncbi:MAG TPA: YebC/PmpR family DNA-binding transcriptional regulator [Clostridia bacterium]|nr:YebC/PmpR family DNA-binding transcriptional regulator [Clostridia bacterium]